MHLSGPENGHTKGELKQQFIDKYLCKVCIVGLGNGVLCQVVFKTTVYRLSYCGKS